MTLRYNIMMRRFAFIVVVMSCVQCYSFKSTSISPDIDSFLVENFNVTTLAAPPNLNITFTNRLQNQIERETRLKYRENDPDIILSGSIIDFDVSSQGARADGTTSFDRLSISVRVSFVNTQDDENNWEQNFQAFEDYESSENLLTVQDQLIDVIFTEITENVVNRSFSSW